VLCQCRRLSLRLSQRCERDSSRRLQRTPAGPAATLAPRSPRCTPRGGPLTSPPGVPSLLPPGVPSLLPPSGSPHCSPQGSPHCSPQGSPHSSPRGPLTAGRYPEEEEEPPLTARRPPAFPHPTPRPSCRISSAWRCRAAPR